MVRDGAKAPPHHEGFETSSFRSIAKRRVSKDEALQTENCPGARAENLERLQQSGCLRWEARPTEKVA